MGIDTVLGVLATCGLVAQVALLVPMVPGGQIDTRDFSSMPRWQFRSFNVFLVSLGIAALATAWMTASGQSAGFVATVVVGALYCLVFALDLGRVFPVVHDSLPVQLLILEALSLALAAVIATLGILGCWYAG